MVPSNESSQVVLLGLNGKLFHRSDKVLSSFTVFLYLRGTMHHPVNFLLNSNANGIRMTELLVR